jgi:hypothetical protein
LSSILGIPKNSLDQFGIERLTADDFPVHQWRFDTALVLRRIVEQVIDYKKDMAAHIALPERMVPKFTGLMRTAEESDWHGPGSPDI